MDRKDTKLIREDTLHSGFFRMVRLRIQHRLFGGGWSMFLDREVVMHGKVGAVIPYDPIRDSVVLIEQFRNGKFAASDPEPWSVSIAVGIVEAGESLSEMARRETLEETGCPVGRLEKALTFYSSPGGSSQHVTLFCAEVSVVGAGGLHGVAAEGEDIRVFVVPFKKIQCMIDSDQFDNAVTIVGLQWLAHHRERLRRQWI